MKATISFICAAIVMAACTKESDTLTDALQNSVPGNTTVLPAIKRGVLNPTSGIQVTGVAKIVQQPSGLQVQLDSFSISGGPDLKVYLSQAATPGNHLNLGNLKANSGTQFYNIPANTNTSSYTYVLIHCQQYNHLFSYASLQ